MANLQANSTTNCPRCLKFLHEEVLESSGSKTLVSNCLHCGFHQETPLEAAPAPAESKIEPKGKAKPQAE